MEWKVAEVILPNDQKVVIGTNGNLLRIRGSNFAPFEIPLTYCTAPELINTGRMSYDHLLLVDHSLEDLDSMKVSRPWNDTPTIELIRLIRED